MLWPVLCRCSDHRRLEPAAANEDGTKPDPPAVPIALELFLKGYRKLGRRELGVDQQLFADEPRGSQRVERQAIAKLLQQHSTHHRRWDELVGHQSDAERGWGALMDGLGKPQRARELPGRQVAEVQQIVTDPVELTRRGAGRARGMGRREGRVRHVQEVQNTRLELLQAR